MMELYNYVVGFGFNENGSNVILIEKKRPDWQAGFLNGVGGHIEKMETPYDAMYREFQEETGVSILRNYWDLFATLIVHRYQSRVFFFRVFSDVILRARTIADEKVIICFVNTLATIKTISNLKWLIPLALDRNIGTPVNFYEGGE